MQAFRTKLLPRHPPVFGEWFLRTFTDPTSWFVVMKTIYIIDSLVNMYRYRGMFVGRFVVEPYNLTQVCHL